MFNMAKPKVSAKKLTEVLVKQNLLKEVDVENFSIALISNAAKARTSAFKFLIIVGALFFYLSLTGFLFATKLLNLSAPGSFIFWGIVFIFIAFLLDYFSKNSTNIDKAFFGLNVSFFSMVSGKILFVWGFVKLVDLPYYWDIPLAIFIVTLPTYFSYRLALDQFLSSLALLSFVVASLLKSFGTEHIELVHHTTFFILLLTSAFLLTYRITSMFYSSFSKALVFYLFLDILSFSLNSIFNGDLVVGFGYESKLTLHVAIITVFLAIALIFTIGWAAGDLKKLLHPPLLLACLGVIILGSISLPGVIFCLILMILGYQKNDRYLLGLGFAFLPIFLILYYYNLNTDLLTKSGILVGSGLVLLAGRYYLKLYQLDKEVAS